MSEPKPLTPVRFPSSRDTDCTGFGAPDPESFPPFESGYRAGYEAAMRDIEMNREITVTETIHCTCATAHDRRDYPHADHCALMRPSEDTLPLIEKPGIDPGDAIAALSICGASGAYGAYGEPLACAHRRGHHGDHAWASLPTFVDGSPVGGRVAGITADEHRAMLLDFCEYLDTPGGDRVADLDDPEAVVDLYLDEYAERMQDAAAGKEPTP